jgi:hypothetical protein
MDDLLEPCRLIDPAEPVGDRMFTRRLQEVSEMCWWAMPSSLPHRTHGRTRGLLDRGQ